MENERKLKILSWSGGKDSTASVILAHENGEPVDLIIMALVWFDRKRGIYGENPEHLRWVMEYAKPLFESWGYKVVIVSSDKDYMGYFYQKRKRSKHPENIGKYVGFVFGGGCRLSGHKAGAIKKYLKGLHSEYETYVGISIEETKRLENMKKRGGQISLLEKYGYTGEDARKLCEQYGLLSPTYQYAKRGGCWFCPNQGVKEMSHMRATHPELWNELIVLDKVPNTISKGFRYGKSLSEISAELDRYDEKQKGDQRNEPNRSKR